MKFSLEKFSCKNIFVGTTPYRIDACASVVILIFVASINHKNIFTTKISGLILRYCMNFFQEINLTPSMHVSQNSLIPRPHPRGGNGLV